MFSLRKLGLDVKNEMNKEMLIKLLEIFPNIEELSLSGQFSDINFDSFINLKKLSLFGDLLYGFNFEVFKNICNQLEELYIEFNNMNDKMISKLLYGHYFPKPFKLKHLLNKAGKESF